MGIRPHLLVALLVVALVVSSVTFAVDVSGSGPQPVAFEATTEGGLTAAAQTQAAESNAVLPRAEAFYTQYQYPVGYVGLAFFLNDLHRAGRLKEFGQLRTVFVSDFTDSDAHLNQNGTLVASYEASIDWVAARDAYFVVDSRAETVGRTPAIVPFGEQAPARSFARRYDGSVVRWETLRSRQYNSVERTASDWRAVVRQRRKRAARRVRRARRLTERPVSVTVGKDVETLQAALHRAPPNTTVRVPAGRYNVTTVQVTKPLTVTGAGPDSTVVSGNGRGSVFNVTGKRVAVTDMNVSGVGNRTETGPVLVDENYTYRKMHKVYGRGAAGIVFAGADGSYVSDVTISTPASGILVRHSPRTVISNTTIYAPPDTKNNSRVISVLSSPGTVVENSDLWGGFHSLLAIDMRGIVVQNIHAEGAVTGFHSVYASRALVSNSSFTDMFKSIMSALESYGNAAVGNDVRNSVVGIDFAGSRSYVAGNTIVHNRQGLVIERRATVYRNNIVGYNHEGVTVGDAFPTNRVTGNDFVGNDRHATVQSDNVLFVWGESGRGNYWGGMPGLDRDGDGYLDRNLVPTSSAGRLTYRTAGGDTLARSPAVALLRSLQTAVPGLRSDGILDMAPLASPNRPQAVARVAANYSAEGPYRPAGDSDPYDYHASYDIPHSANNTFG